MSSPFYFTTSRARLDSIEELDDGQINSGSIQVVSDDVSDETAQIIYNGSPLDQVLVKYDPTLDLAGNVKGRILIDATSPQSRGYFSGSRQTNHFWLTDEKNFLNQLEGNNSTVNLTILQDNGNPLLGRLFADFQSLHSETEQNYVTYQNVDLSSIEIAVLADALTVIENEIGGTEGKSNDQIALEIAIAYNGLTKLDHLI